MDTKKFDPAFVAGMEKRIKEYHAFVIWPYKTRSRAQWRRRQHIAEGEPASVTQFGSLWVVVSSLKEFREDIKREYKLWLEFGD